ncbi:MAG: Gfo/Idh/MocA family oxidoreductase [Acidobacteria bacterium]|nr:Gfo/Idh/MocA family oxidoreductase [Acidobacteriota bacterium]
MSKKINRRDFIKKTSVTSAGAGLILGTSRRTAAAFKVMDNANDRIRMGFIGVGARAQQVLSDVVRMPGFEVVGICDAYQGRLERAQERTKGQAKIYKNHQELLASPDIDAVYIGTPDHWHKDHAIAAVEAGKDVYIEKPLTYTVADGLEIIAAVKKTGRILQVGSQGISTPIQQKAREIVQSGRLGQITMVRSTTNRNSAGGAWIYPIPPDANEQTVNWEMFEGSAPKHAFSLERFFRWRCYQDYSGGMATDLFVHVMTTLHYILDAKAPEMVVAAGALYRWKDSRDVPDTLDAILQYPEGFTVNLSGTFNNESGGGRSIEILGTKGSLSLGRDLAFSPESDGDDNGWIVDAWPSRLQNAYYNDPKVIEREVPRKWKPRTIAGEEHWGAIGPNSNVLHMESFQNAVKDRKQPVEDVFAGHRAAAVAHMVNLAARQKKPVYWDHSRNNIKA